MDLNNLINILGWTLINSLWQGLLIAIILSIVLLFIHPKYAKIRSMLAYASLLLVFAVSIRTYSDLSNTKIVEPQKNNIIASTVRSDMVIFPDYTKTQAEKIKSSASILENIVGTISIYAGKNLKYIVVLWIAGILILTVRMIGGYFYMQKIKTRHIFDVNEKWQMMVKSISEIFNISKQINLFESAIVKFPTVIGFFKPVILMPLGTLAEMNVDQVEMILAHELAHVKRSDYLLNLVQSFLEIIYFFNPSVWIISKFIRLEREYACDDLALSINQDSLILAKALLTVQQKEVNRPVLAISALGTKNSILWRIKRMTQKNNANTNYPKKLILSLLLVGSLITLTIIACSTSSDSSNYENEANKLQMRNDLALSSPAIQKEAELPVEIVNMNAVDEREPMKNIIGLENEKRNFNFHKNDSHWKGIIEKGKLIQLNKDGENIPSGEMGKYENFILTTLNEIDDGMAELDVNMSELRKEMKNLKKELKNIKVDINLEQLDKIKEHFNSEEFQKEMEKLKESLKEMKIEFNGEWKNDLKKAMKNKGDWDIDIEHFKSEEFKNEMKNLKHELESLKNLDINIDFDKESFKESMKELKESMKNLKVELSDLDINLSDLKVDMSNLKIEMKKLKAFIKDLRNDLVSEGYLNNSDEEFDMDLNKNNVTINGKKLPNNLHKRYLEMYKNHFGKELEDNFRINN